MALHNKAIRDKIPEIIEKSGLKFNVKKLTDKDFLEEMEKKLDEEVSEYHESKSVEEIVETYSWSIDQFQSHLEDSRISAMFRKC